MAMELVTRQLTEKQAGFVEAYLNGRRNITGAAIDAGYSESTASQIGSALLRTPHVQAAVAWTPRRRPARPCSR